MKPTTDIVEELRLYNRWRRGDEAITAPDPTALGKLLDDAADRIEHLFARGIHTCHDDCQRPMCVLRRERDKALADLAALRARAESAPPAYRQLIAGEIIQPGDEIDACVNAMKEQPRWKPVTQCIGEPAPDPSFPAHRIYRRRIESAPPAKHPDTERLDWLEDPSAQRYLFGAFVMGGSKTALRSAIDAARKQGGTP